MKSRRVWWMAIAAWIAVIGFSSTNAAFDYCERAYDWLYGLVFGAGSSSSAGDSLLHILADKGLHISLFLVLGILLCQVIPEHNRFVKVVLAGLIIGSGSEYLQSFFPGRDPAIRDVLINVAGTSLGAFAAIRIAKRQPDRP